METTKPIRLIPVISAMLVSQLFARGWSFQNYDNDPDLARALQHDPEYTPDPNKESRAEAEKYYMAYLEKDIPSFQRAKVYCQLGVMYTTTANPERGEQRDREKAEKYFQKVLELEPERIGRATIRARTMLSSLHSLPKAEKLSRALKYYEWLSSLDDEKIRSKWLPSAPGETQISSSRMRALRNSVTAAGRTLAKNTVSRAASMPNADILLAEIINRFPDRQIAEFARQKLNTRVDKLANETLDMLAKDEPQEIPLAPQPQPPPPAVEQSQEPPDHNQAQGNPPGASKHPSLPLVILLVSAAAIAIAILAPRRTTNKTSDTI
jgi:tetratricopeptide (TPR) repeat protein